MMDKSKGIAARLYECFRSHRKTKSNDKNRFKPARHMYFILLLITVVLSFLCVLIPMNSPWFTIVTGISCGGVASTIIAWLIDESNSNSERIRAKDSQQRLLDKLFFSFDSGLMVLILSEMEYIQDEQARRWFEWIELTEKVFKENQDFRYEFFRSMGLFFKDLCQNAHGILSQSIVLIEYKIIENEDEKCLSIILTICDVALNELNSKHNDEDIFRSLMTYCKMIKMLLDYSPSLQDINKQKIEPRLYKQLIEVRKSDNK